MSFKIYLPSGEGGAVTVATVTLRGSYCYLYTYILLAFIQVDRAFSVTRFSAGTLRCLTFVFTLQINRIGCNS